MQPTTNDPALKAAKSAARLMKIQSFFLWASIIGFGAMIICVLIVVGIFVLG